jgi:SlyX protein
MSEDSKQLADFQERLHDLESRSAFQEDTIGQLNTVVIEQQQMIDKLNLKVEALSGAVQAVSPGDTHSNSLVDEKPPHY